MGGGQEVRKKQLVNIVLHSCRAAVGVSLPYVYIGDFLSPFQGNSLRIASRWQFPLLNKLMNKCHFMYLATFINYLEQ